MPRKLYRLKKEVETLLDTHLPIDMFFHSKYHTLRVYETARFYGELENISESDKLLLLSAALLHDVGFTKSYKNHEDIGCEIGEGILKNLGYSEDQIQKITEIIMATKMPQSPKNLLGKIICDSDLDHLGCSDYLIQGALLREEWRIHLGKESSDKEWNEFELDFLKNHSFFTKSASDCRGKGKDKNILRLESWLAVKNSSLKLRL